MNIFGEIGKLQYSVLEFAMCVLSYPFFYLDFCADPENIHTLPTKGIGIS